MGYHRIRINNSVINLDAISKFGLIYTIKNPWTASGVLFAHLLETFVLSKQQGVCSNSWILRTWKTKGQKWISVGWKWLQKLRDGIQCPSHCIFTSSILILNVPDWILYMWEDDSERLEVFKCDENGMRETQSVNIGGDVFCTIYYNDGK